MSIQSALDFMQFARANREVQERVLALRGSKALLEMAAIAREHGFDFTEAEYRAAVVASAGGELSDEALSQLTQEMGLAHQMEP